jgi:beta-N-acetylhexosaminidase
MTKIVFTIFMLGFSLLFKSDFNLKEKKDFQPDIIPVSHNVLSPFEMKTSTLVRSKLTSMSLRDKIAQMVISSTIPENFDENSSEYKKLKRLCTNTKIGGFIFFKGSSSDYARLSNALQQFSETPLLISSDFERGTGMRVTDGMLFPNNMAIGATGNYDLSYKMGLEIARESRLLGVQQNYAPVCDVNNNPKNPIINVRSFGEDPELVSKMSEGEIKGLQEGKVIATSKHFPGHGDTEIDSHQDLPVLNFDMDRLNKIELVPFKNAISKNVMSVMIAHLSFPELETRSHIPASLSNNIVNGLLIGNLGFKGLVVTDALNMKGITKYFSTSEVALMCVNAGIDLILMPIDEEATIKAIENAVNNGSITEDRIDRSVEKILKAKEWAGLFENRTVNENDAYKLIHSDEADKLNQQIADESITLVKDDNNIIPLKSSINKVLLINLSDGKDNINSDYLVLAAAQYFKNIKTLNISSDIISPEQSSEINDAGSYDCVIIGIFAKIRFGTGKISILQSQIDIINSIISKNKNTAVISYGNPYLLSEFPDVPNYICAYGDADVSINSSLNAITGKIKIKGKLPVSIGSAYSFGTGIVR